MIKNLFFMAIYRIVLRNSKIAYEISSPCLIYLTDSGSTDYFVSIVGRTFNSIALDVYNKAWTWGDNSYGQLGINEHGDKCIPRAVFGNRNFIAIDTGIHSAAIDTDGKAWTWGNNSYGQLGDNTTNGKSIPVAVCGDHTFCYIKVGGRYTSEGHNTLGLGYNGKLWSWGGNNYGQLGDNTVVCKSTPIAVYGTHTFCLIDCGQRHSSSVDNHGKAWGWGYNGYGCLGNNISTDRSTPVAVCGAHTFCQISCGQHHVLAIDNHGKAWAWGSNFNVGTLGDNTSTNRSTPVAVCGGHTFCDIEAGNYHSMAIDNHGKAWCWGWNNDGQLGANTSSGSVSTPVAVCGNHTFNFISGGYNTLALDKNNKAWSWGENTFGELGINSVTNKSTPVAVCFP